MLSKPLLPNRRARDAEVYLPALSQITLRVHRLSCGTPATPISLPGALSNSTLSLTPSPKAGSTASAAPTTARCRSEKNSLSFRHRHVTYTTLMPIDISSWLGANLSSFYGACVHWGRAALASCTHALPSMGNSLSGHSESAMKSRRAHGVNTALCMSFPDIG